MSSASPRVAAIAGRLFAAGVLLPKAVLLQGNPLPSASMEAVRAFYGGSGGRVGLAVGGVAVARAGFSVGAWWEGLVPR